MIREEEGEWEGVAMLNPLSVTIRTKKLGVLIRDARLELGKSLEECADSIGVDPAQFEAIELGDKTISLPELEMLAMFLNVSIDHFWGEKTLAETDNRPSKLDLKALFKLRQRMIGTLIRQARLDADISSENLAEAVGLTMEKLEAYELGEESIPLPVLEQISNSLNRKILDFLDEHGPVGVWANQQKTMKEILDLPEELQSFVSKPINRPYLELAQRLSEMNVDKLRAVGEGILEITL